MNRFLIPLALVTAGVCCAQDSAPAAPANPMTMTAKGFYMIVSNNVIKAVQEMPEANFAWSPTPDVRTFAQLAGHAADAQYHFCALASGDTASHSSGAKTAKADLVAALQDAQSYCQKAMSNMTDAQGSSTMVKFMGHDMPALALLYINTAHLDEHYGNMVTYLRLKGLVPPSSQKSDH